MKSKTNYGGEITEIVEYLLETTARYSRTVRFNLYDRLTNISLDVLEGIVEAIYAQQRTDILRRANLDIENVRAPLQISCNERHISIAQYRYIAEEVNDAGACLAVG